MAEVYTIKQVTDLTDVPENTIRSWERRFGWPTPSRTNGNQRRYTAEHLNEIRQVAADRAAGRTIEQALERIGVSEVDVTQTPVVPPDEPRRPRLLPSPTAATSRSNPVLTCLISGDLSAANQSLADSYVTFGLDNTMTESLEQASSVIQERRLTGAMSEGEALLAESWLVRKVDALLEQSSPESGQDRVVVVPVHDEGLEIRVLVLATCLSRAGYAVDVVRRPLNVAALRGVIERDIVIALGSSDQARRIVEAIFPDTESSSGSGAFILVHNTNSGATIMVADRPRFGEAVQQVFASLRQRNRLATRSSQ